MILSSHSYCTNISFYLVLKAKRVPAHNHPVIERLLTYRNVSPHVEMVPAAAWTGVFFTLYVQQATESCTYTVFNYLISKPSCDRCILFFYFDACLQLINELGAVDARLASQFRQLLSGEETEKATSRPAGGKKSTVSAQRKKVRVGLFCFLFFYTSTHLTGHLSRNCLLILNVEF